MRTICLKIIKVSALIVCLGVASSACFWGHDVHDGRGGHHEEHHEDDHRGDHR